MGGVEMANVPADLLYTEEHEYLKQADQAGVYTVGITDYAQGELGDIVFVELPGVGDKFGKNDVFGTVEAVKAVSDLYCPVSGEVVEVNSELASDPSVVNSDPYGKGWMIKLRVSNDAEVKQLLSGTQYESHIEK
jgi:glycine cleavage system H protein